MRRRQPGPVTHGAPAALGAPSTDSNSSASARTPGSDQNPPDFDSFDSFLDPPTSAWEFPQTCPVPAAFPDPTYGFPQYSQADLYWQSFQPVDPLTNPLYPGFARVQPATFLNPALDSTANTLIGSSAFVASQWATQPQSFDEQSAGIPLDTPSLSSVSQSPDLASAGLVPQQWLQAPTSAAAAPAHSLAPSQALTYNLQHRTVPTSAPSSTVPVVPQPGDTASQLPRQRVKASTGLSKRHKTQAGVQDVRPTKRDVSHAVRRAITSGVPPEPVEDELPACWRCRRYKKQCDGPGECSNCMKGNFRVWPESLGCRRGCLEDLIIELIPEGAAVILTKAAGTQPLTPSWRAQPNFNRKAMIEHRLPSSDRLQRLSLKVQSIGMYGDEFISLFNIIARYQTFQKKQSSVLDAAIEVLDSTCDIYHNFVVNDWPLDAMSIQKATTLCSVQFHRLGRTFVASALSGRRADWLPSFLSMCLGINAVIIMIDTAFALPPKWQQLLYPNIIKTAQFMRETFYPVISDLLRAGTNGSRPFEMSCWSYVPDPVTNTVVRNPNGMKLVAGDEPTFDGMKALQEWYQQNMGIISLGSRWASAEPFSDPQAPSIIAMLGLFRYSTRL